MKLYGLLMPGPGKLQASVTSMRMQTDVVSTRVGVCVNVGVSVGMENECQCRHHWLRVGILAHMRVCIINPQSNLRTQNCHGCLGCMSVTNKRVCVMQSVCICMSMQSAESLTRFRKEVRVGPENFPLSPRLPLPQPRPRQEPIQLPQTLHLILVLPLQGRLKGSQG